MRSSDLRGKRVLLLGTGREAHAFAAAMRPEFAELQVIDEREGESARRWRESWGDDAPLTIASSPEAFLDRIDVAVTSPGIPPHHPLRSTIAAAGIPVTMPTELWLGDHASITTGITGSKGKSTTAALLHGLSRAHAVSAELGGNIGIPVYSLPPAERYIVELSSYQSSTVSVSPDVVVFTALFPEHLDWHGGERRYIDDKLNLARHGARMVVANGEDDRLRAELERRLPGVAIEWVGPGSRWGLGSDGWIERAGEPLVATDGWRLRGRHNAVNAALALASLEASGIDVDADVSARILREFAPLEHRLEAIPDPSGLTFVDDSLSTAPQAAVRALEAYGGEQVVLLVGGHDRGVDYAPLTDHLTRHPVVALIGLPGSGGDVADRLAEAAIHTETASDMDDAVRRARRLAPPGGFVLLSPAAASYGRYADYRERSADFRRAISESAQG